MTYLFSTDYDDNFNCNNYSKHFGGSPANITMNINRLGGNSTIADCVGKDGLGDFLVNHLKNNSVDTTTINIVNYSTSMVLVTKSKTTPISIFYCGADYNYVGLLAEKNDDEHVKATGEGSEINRHNFTVEEIEQDLQKEVVQRLLKLIRFRNNYPAFNGNFSVVDSKDNEILLLWKEDENFCKLKVNLQTNKSTIEYVDDNGNISIYHI